MAKIKATETDTSTDASTDAAATKGAPKPQALVDELDFGAAVDGDDLAGAPRRSKWTALLEKLYDATVNENKVPRNEAGELMFIKVGSFTNVNGARTQARALEQKGFDQTYEFKSVTREGGSDMFARVIETDDAAVEAADE